MLTGHRARRLVGLGERYVLELGVVAGGGWTCAREQVACAWVRRHAGLLPRWEGVRRAGRGSALGSPPRRTGHRRGAGWPAGRRGGREEGWGVGSSTSMRVVGAEEVGPAVGEDAAWRVGPAAAGQARWLGTHRGRAGMHGVGHTREEGKGGSGNGPREVGRENGPREEGRNGWASRRGKGRKPALGWETKLGREQAEREWVLISLFYLFISFLFLSFFCFYSLRFNFKLEHKLINEKNSQPPNSSIKINMYSRITKQLKTPLVFLFTKLTPIK
jgi:hypothetical protein